MNLIRTTILLLAITFNSFASLHSMEKLTYHAYKTMIPLVDIAQTLKHIFCFFIYYNARNKANTPVHTLAIQQKLKQIEKNIRQDEQNAIQELATHYKITDEQLQNIISLINQRKKYTQEYMNSAHPETTHDETFPQEIFSLLQKNNINPHSITLKNSDVIYKENKNTIATASMMITENSVQNNVLYISKIITPPAITIYPSFWKDPNICKISILLHETEHLKEGHDITKTLLAKEISLISQTDEENILKNSAMDQITTIHERQAEVLPSLRDAQSAKIMRCYRSYEYYHKRLFIKHYAQLAEIDELHKLNARLNYYASKPYEKIDIPKIIEKHNRYTNPPTHSTIAVASIRSKASSSSGFPERGNFVTASE